MDEKEGRSACWSPASSPGPGLRLSVRGIQPWPSSLWPPQSFISSSCSEGLKMTRVQTGPKRLQNTQRQNINAMLIIHLAVPKKSYCKSEIYQDMTCIANNKQNRSNTVQAHWSHIDVFFQGNWVPPSTIVKTGAWTVGGHWSTRRKPTQPWENRERVLATQLASSYWASEWVGTFSVGQCTCSTQSTSFCPAQTFPPSFIKAEQCEPGVPAVCQTYSTQHGDIHIHSLSHGHTLILTPEALVKTDRWMDRWGLRREIKRKWHEEGGNAQVLRWGG